jgi:hypothetical protein
MGWLQRATGLLHDWVTYSGQTWRAISGLLEDLG